MLQNLRDWASLVRDLGLILGIPALVAVGMQLYDLQLSALQEQKAIVEERNKLLRETQYDRALSIIRAQKELFQMEREDLETQLVEARRGNEQDQQKIDALEQKLNDLESVTKALGKFGVEATEDGGIRIFTETANIGVRG